MASLHMLLAGIELCAIPVLGLALLVLSKIFRGDGGRLAERFFVATLLLATFATFRTMLAGETLWLVHAFTMALMIVGSVSVPARGDAGLNRSTVLES